MVGEATRRPTPADRGVEDEQPAVLVPGVRAGTRPELADKPPPREAGPPAVPGRRLVRIELGLGGHVAPWQDEYIIDTQFYWVQKRNASGRLQP